MKAAVHTSLPVWLTPSHFPHTIPCADHVCTQAAAAVGWRNVTGPLAGKAVHHMDVLPSGVGFAMFSQPAEWWEQVDNQLAWTQDAGR